MKSPIRFFLVVFALAWPLRPSAEEAVLKRNGLVRVRITDHEGRPTAARAWVDDAVGNRLFKPGAPESCTPYERDRSFSCDGWFELTAPAGRISIHVEKGKEFVPVDREVELESGGILELVISLRRWVNMPERGYYSSDLHLHFGSDKPAVLQQLSLADDVHVVPAFTYWLRGNEKAWNRGWPAWDGGDVSQVDAHHFVTRSNLEIERIARNEIPGGSVGASFLFNLGQPLFAPRFDVRFPTDAALCRWAKQTSPDCVIDTDKPSWGETVIGAALGVYDVAQVCHNHYHRAETLPGGWGMAGPMAPGEKDLREPDELFHRTNAQYYHWLNCGIRMGVSGGSAMGVMPVPLGYSRTYARVDGALTPARYWAAVKAGRTFATSGPMLTLDVDGKEMGATLRRSSAEHAPLSIRAHLQSREAIQTVDLIEDGRVVEPVNPGALAEGTILDRVFTWSVRPRRSGWYAVRAVFLAPDGRLRQAHTSPVYVLVDGKPIAVRASAEYMIRRVDQLIEIAKMPGRYRQESDRSEVMEIYREARRFYQNVAATAAKI